MTPLLQAFRTALLHFVWQGALIAALLEAALWLLRRRSANARYAASCVALVVLAAAPAVSTWLCYPQPVEVRPFATAAAALKAEALPAPATGAPVVDWRGLVDSWMLPLWGLGVLLFSLRMIWGCAQVSAFRRRGSPAPAEALSVLTELSRRMGVTRRVEVLMASAADGPAVVGWLRPAILLPASALSGLSPEFLEAVLAHELAHIRRHDYLVNLLQMAAETLLFYHPAVWRASSRIRHERELCCDDLAVRATGGALGYARALTALEKIRLASPVMAMGGAGGSLLYRIQRLTGGGAAEYRLSRLAAVLALSLALACAALSANWARAQNPAPAASAAQQDSAPKPAPGKPPRTELAQARTAAPRQQAPPIAPPAPTANQDKELIQALREALSKTDSLELRAELSRVLSAAYSREPEMQQVVNRYGRVIQWYRRAQPGSAPGTLQSIIVEDRTREGERLRQLERLAEINRTSQTNGFLREELLVRERDLESLRRTLGPQHPGVVRQQQEILELMRRLQASNEVGAGAGSMAGRILTKIAVEGLAGLAREALLSQLPLHTGDRLSTENIDAAIQAAAKFNPRLQVILVPLENDRAELRIFLK